MSDSDEKPTTSLAKEKQEAKDKKVDEKVVAKESEETGAGFDVIQNSIRALFEKLTLTTTHGPKESEPTEQVLEEVSFQGLMKYWKEKGFRRIIIMAGAGMSTSAGIPDFRSPGSGLYDNLQKYDLPYPMAIFELEYFKSNPEPFFALAKELYPGVFKPTPAHYFVRLLHKKGKLLRHYTQNIDTLERIAGIPEEKLVEAHGTFYKNHCLRCRRQFSMPWVKEQIFRDQVPTCVYCGGLVKPDIVFFGEALPERFHQLPDEDFPKCDLLIIMGTSLEVQPFSTLVDRAPPSCVRLLINRTKVGGADRSAWTDAPHFDFDNPKNKRDVFYQGDCDDAVWDIVRMLHWEIDLKELMESDARKCITVRLKEEVVKGDDKEAVKKKDDKEADKKDGKEAVKKDDKEADKEADEEADESNPTTKKS